jgi:RimJ/RimL family protein N-acetyltransferase
MLPISTQRISLRDWQLDDLAMYRTWMQPGQRWQEFDGPYYPPPSPTHIDERIERLRWRTLSGDWPDPRSRLVVADRATDALLGTVNWYWIGQETNWLAIGISLFDPTTWGQGFGYEALGQWCEYLWTTMPQIVRLDLRTWSGNHGMVRLAEKLGFQREACFRNARIVRGVYYDGLGYGVLREEWRERYPQKFGR